MTISHWRRSHALGTVRGDAIVVGAGICGLSAALHLERRGLVVHVVERGTIGCGASSRNAGFLMRGAAESYARAAEIHGRDTARLLWRWTEENLAGLRAEGVESLPSTRRVPSCLLAMDEAERDELARSRDMLREDGFEVGWLDPGRCGDSIWAGTGERRPLAGLLNPADAACNPVEVLTHLAHRLSRPVWEGQETIAIEPGEGARDLEVRTTDGRFVAPRVLVCVNAYAGLLLPSLTPLVHPKRGQMLAFRDESIRLDYSYYARFGYDYVRRAADGAIVIGGCRDRFVDTEVGLEDRTTDEVQAEIERLAKRLLGVRLDCASILQRWAGTMAMTADGLPIIAPVHGPWLSGSVWFCGAFNGHGMSMAHRAARAAVDAMMGDDRSLFGLDRASLVTAPRRS